MGKCFTDRQGREWTPSITLGALSSFARETGLSLDALSDPGKIKFEHLAAGIWHSVARKAGERKVTRQDFENSMGLKEIREAATLLMASVQDEFPDAAEEVEDEIASLEGADEVPLASEASASASAN